MIYEEGFQFSYLPLALDSLATPLLPNSLATPLHHLGTAVREDSLEPTAGTP